MSVTGAGDQTMAAAVSDLFFRSRIKSTAEALGATLHLFRTAGQLTALIPQTRPQLVILDLSVDELDPEQVVQAAQGVPVLAFGSHMETTRLQAAHKAGCHQVMANSRFAEHLPRLLQNYLEP